MVGGTAFNAGADVHVNVNIGPPPIAVAAPPEVVLVPNSDVYFVPGVDYDVFYYGGYWWSPRGDRWYRAREYNGPWGVVSQRMVPPPVYRVPHDYRQVYRHERHIPYGQWKKEHHRHGGHDQGKHKGHGEHGNHGGNGHDKYYEHGEHGHGHGDQGHHRNGHGHGRD
jgi:hypothetical protein